MAWRILLDCGVCRLPVKISGICKMLGVRVVLFQPSGKSDGKCIIVDEQPIIWVSRDCAVSRQRFTAAHELGHLLLGHVGKYELVNREPSPDDNPREQAANVFASRILSPARVLWGCGVKSAADIQRLCDISEQAATIRMARMADLYRLGRFLSSPLEREVFERFGAYIAEHRL